MAGDAALGALGYFAGQTLLPVEAQRVGPLTAVFALGIGGVMASTRCRLDRALPRAAHEGLRDEIWVLKRDRMTIASVNMAATTRPGCTARVLLHRYSWTVSDHDTLRPAMAGSMLQEE